MLMLKCTSNALLYKFQSPMFDPYLLLCIPVQLNPGHRCRDRMRAKFKSSYAISAYHHKSRELSDKMINNKFHTLGTFPKSN